MDNIKYIIISPVRDEEKHIESTLRSVVAQTVLPVDWLIVDDNSIDNTASIIKKYLSGNTFINYLKISHNENRQPGKGVIDAFNSGFKLVENSDYDFIVKLDGDLEFENDYFEKIFRYFSDDDRLGIASGVYYELHNDNWSPVIMPSYHAAGASKVIRKDCFNEIDGFIASRGWDTVDEIRAMAKGWKTGHFDDCKILHLKNEGTGIGIKNTNIMHGEIFYLTGGSKLFFLFKLLHRALLTRPFFLNSLYLFTGYFNAALKRKKILVTRDEAQVYKRLQLQRLFSLVTNLK